MAWRCFFTLLRCPEYAITLFTACFNICTGDIGKSTVIPRFNVAKFHAEDAPAPSAIHSFKTQISDGKIYVTADPSLTSKEQKSRAPKLSPSDSITSEPGVVVVGGGSGTFYLIESLREVTYLLLKPERY